MANVNWTAIAKMSAKVAVGTVCLLGLNQTMNSAADDYAQIVKPKKDKTTVEVKVSN